MSWVPPFNIGHNVTMSLYTPCQGAESGSQLIRACFNCRRLVTNRPAQRENVVFLRPMIRNGQCADYVQLPKKR